MVESWCLVEQGLFDFDDEQPAVTTQAPADDRASIIEQIVRDSKVLEEDEIYHVPSREFYVERIALHKRALEQL
jgi:hypothetical protein